VSIFCNFVTAPYAVPGISPVKLFFDNGLVLAQRVIFTMKAEGEMYADGLTHELVFEAIINAPTITKTLRSQNPQTRQRETLYVIRDSPTIR
jgi:hypothetical protein